MPTTNSAPNEREPLAETEVKKKNPPPTNNRLNEVSPNVAPPLRQPSNTGVYTPQPREGASTTDSDTVSRVTANQSRNEDLREKTPDLDQPEKRDTTSSSGKDSSKNPFSDCPQCPMMKLVRNNGQTILQSAYPMAVSEAEITVAEWNVCVDEGACPRYESIANSKGQEMVRGIRLRDAASYVDWLSRKTGQSYRLLNMAMSPGRSGSRCQAEPGWEWLDENCSSTGELPYGFRVTRVMKTASRFDR
jgi:hypothetical protein